MESSLTAGFSTNNISLNVEVVILFENAAALLFRSSRLPSLGLLKSWEYDLGTPLFRL